jgi:hypothetical protein
MRLMNLMDLPFRTRPSHHKNWKIVCRGTRLDADVRHYKLHVELIGGSFVMCPVFCVILLVVILGHEGDS